MAAELPRSGWREMALWFLRRRRLFQVSGASMEPTLSAGAVVLLDPHAYRTTPPQENDIIVARHPRRADLWIVKRVATVLERPSNCLLEKRDETLLLVLSSDNHAAPGASDSRSFGPIAGSLVLGRVTSRLR